LGHHYYTVTRHHTSSSSYNTHTHTTILVCIRDFNYCSVLIRCLHTLSHHTHRRSRSSHTQTHTHTLSLAHTLSLSHTLSLTHTHTPGDHAAHTRSLSHTHTHTRTRTRTHTRDRAAHASKSKETGLRCPMTFINNSLNIESLHYIFQQQEKYKILSFI